MTAKTATSDTQLRFVKVLPFGRVQRRTASHRALQRYLVELTAEYERTKVQLPNETDTDRERWLSFYISAHLDATLTVGQRLVILNLARIVSRAAAGKYQGYSTYHDGTVSPEDIAADVALALHEKDIEASSWWEYVGRAVKHRVIELGPKRHAALKRVPVYQTQSYATLPVETQGVDGIKEWEHRETYQEALTLVSEPERTALVLFVEEGQTYQDIAKALKVERRTAARYVSTAFEQLKPYRDSFLVA